MSADASSTGLSTRTASVLAYLGWWVTGLIFWALERQDRLVCFHAAQSTIVFGGLALAITLLLAISLVLFTYAPAGASIFAGAAAALWLLGLALWLVALWKASQEERWRIPLAGRWADALAGPDGYAPRA